MAHHNGSMPATSTRASQRNASMLLGPGPRARPRPPWTLIARLSLLRYTLVPACLLLPLFRFAPLSGPLPFSSPAPWPLPFLSLSSLSILCCSPSVPAPPRPSADPPPPPLGGIG